MGNVAAAVKRFGLKGSVSALMVLAMIGSWGNVQTYLSGGHTNMVTTLALASLLGGGLVILSHGILYMQARLSVVYVTVVTVALLAAGVTGMIQSIEYAKHYSGWQPYVLGYGIPFLFEVGLAFFAKALEGEQRRRVLDDMQEALGHGTMQAMAEASHNIDPAMIQKVAQREVNKFAQLVISSTLDDMYTELSVKRKLALSFEVEELRDSAPSPLETALNTAQDGVLRPQIAELNAKKQSKVTERRAQLLQLAAEGSAKLQDVVAALGVAENTIRNDVKAMADHGLSIDNGVLSVSN